VATKDDPAQQLQILNRQRLDLGLFDGCLAEVQLF
jgi:hypothetical protein